MTPQAESPSPLACWCILLIGVVTTSLSFVFIRESSEPPVLLAALRVLLAAIMLAPVYVYTRRRYQDVSFMAALWRATPAGLVLALHFITWVIGARISLGANATIIVNLVPLALPLLVWLLYGEALQPREWLATALALFGLALLAMDGLRLSPAHLLGDAICLLSMVLFALYLALARQHRKLPSVWLYVVPLYAVAGTVSLLLAPFFGSVTPSLNSHNLLMVLGLAGLSTVMGHSAMNFAMQHMRSQTVGIMTLSQFLFAGIIAYWLYGEVPGALFYPASALMAAGMAVVIFNQKTVNHNNPD